MEKSKFRVLIKQYFLRKKSITQTKEKLDKYYGDIASSIYMVKKWFTEFRCGRTSTEDAERSGRPVEVSTSEAIEKIHDMVLANRRLKVREIVAFRKMGAAFAHNRPQTQPCDNFAGMFGVVQSHYERVFATFCNRGRNVDPPQYTGEQTANKVMATVFWDARGIIHIDYLQKGKTIDGEYYRNLLSRFDEELKESDRIWQRKKSFCTRTMHGCTHVQFLWQKSMNWATNCSLIRPIHPI